MKNVKPQQQKKDSIVKKRVFCKLLIWIYVRTMHSIIFTIKTAQSQMCVCDTLLPLTQCFSASSWVPFIAMTIPN